MRILLLSLLLLAALSASAAPGFTFTETPGPYRVGFRLVRQYDYTRVYRGEHDLFTGKRTTSERARPIQTLVWYPAQASGAPMHYADYLALIGSEERFDRSPADEAASAAASLAWLVPRTMKPADVEREKTHAMWAVRDAVATAQRFPVVIYAPSFSASAFENADLCEFLASHGYVVIASPSLGTRGRDMTDDLEGIETQVADIEFLIGYAQGLANADASKIAVAGYSWGGVSNVFAAARDSRIGALVGLDGGIRFVGKLVAEAKYMHPKRIAVPFLYLQSPMPTKAEIAEHKLDDSDDFLLRLRYADVFDVTFPQVVHYHFASEHLRFLDTSDKIVFPGDHSLAEISHAYNAMARYIVDFLDAKLKGDASAGESLAEPPRGMPPRSVEFVLRPADGVPPTRDALAAAVGRRGFGEAAVVYEEFRKKDAAFALTPFEFMTWIGNLQELKHLSDAVEIGKLFVKVHPEMPGAYVWLADSQLMNGDRPSAVENYRKAMRIDPANVHLAKRVQQIEADGDKK